MDVSIIIVHYNTKDLLEACIESILEHVTGIEYEIIVVDNNSPDRSCEKLPRKFPSVKFYLLEENLGYGGGNNYGFYKSSGKYILLLNPDTLFRENSLKTLITFIEVNPDVGVVGPKLLNTDLSFQRSYGKYFNFIKEIFKFFHLYNLYCRLIWSLYEKRKVDNLKYFEVDWVSGAALFIRRSIYREFKGFDRAYFLYYEDVDLCARIKKSGWKILYLPRTNIIHIRGSSTQKYPFSLILGRYKGSLIFANKHLRFYQRLLLKNMIILEILTRMLITMFVPIYTKCTRIERLKGYSESLKVYLNRSTPQN